MSGFKMFDSYKNGVIAVIIIILLIILISRNSQAVVRALVIQETNWQTANFMQMETEHFQIKYLPVDAYYIEGIGQIAEDAYIKVSDIFDYKSKQKTTIIIYPDNSSLAQSFGWDKDERAMGVYWAGTIRLLSPEEWINEKGNWEAVFASEGPVYHEYAHLLVDDITRGNYSRWVTEGIAQYVEKKLTGFEFVDPSSNKDISYYEFAVLEENFDELDQQIAYWESLQVIEYMVDNYGEERLLEVLHYLGDGNSLEQAVRKALGIDYRTFEYNFFQIIQG